MDLDITFDGHAMCTPVYIKMDAKDQLLLSEGVCNQLNIISYHPAVHEAQLDTTTPAVTVPCVRVKLLQTVRVPLLQSKTVPVQFERSIPPTQSFLIEPLDLSVNHRLYIGNSLVQATSSDRAQVIITNFTPFTQKVRKGCWIGQTNEVTVVSPTESFQAKCHRHADVMSISTLDADIRKNKLATLLTTEGPTLNPQDKDRLVQLLLDFRHAFILEEGKRGETDLIRMDIDTGDATTKHQSACRTPSTAREEISRQLLQMQEQGVIRPSFSPWASPVVLVRKKDSSLHFCVDYRGINAVTKPYQFPLP